ncbi:hypothetical protein NPIL_167961 [Nephila pilipes]|uniref:Uncharacterized protein n=1 Tax=Nephila pilipes TaxID=299642 RepID=A0A8X6U1Z4_NEPPI|nr:hypothetical protein NPIL_167961 [Nephila pilipes]
MEESVVNYLSQLNKSQMSSCMPINRQVPQIKPPPPQQTLETDAGMIQSGITNDQVNAARSFQLEAARQQNLVNCHFCRYMSY